MQTYSIMQMLNIVHRLGYIWLTQGSRNWSVSVIKRKGEKDPTQSGPLQRACLYPP
jgi:hypothetical protein